MVARYAVLSGSTAMIRRNRQEFVHTASLMFLVRSGFFPLATYFLFCQGYSGAKGTAVIARAPIGNKRHRICKAIRERENLPFMMG